MAVKLKIAKPPVEESAKETEDHKDFEQDHDTGNPVGEAVAVDDVRALPESQDEPQPQPETVVAESQENEPPQAEVPPTDTPPEDTAEDEADPEIFGQIRQTLEEIESYRYRIEDAKAEKKRYEKRLEQAQEKLESLTRDLVGNGGSKPGASQAESTGDTSKPESQPANTDPNAWRKTPITVLPLEKIEGLGEKKREALIDAIPTLGDLEDARVRAGASGLNTELPKGLGRAIADQLEEFHLTWMTENSELVSCESSTGENQTEDADVIGSVPFNEMSDADQIKYLETRYSEIENNEAWDCVSNQEAFDAGLKDGTYQEPYTDCVYSDYDAIDDYLRGYLSATVVDDGDGEPDEEAEGDDSETVAALSEAEDFEI